MRCTNGGCQAAKRIAARAMSTPQRRRLFSSTSTLTSVSTQASTPDTKASQPPRPKIIFSGIQPTGIPHVGNYLGALKQWKRMQDTAEPDTKLIFSIVDLHALTTSRPHGQLTQWKREMLAAILAIGIDPARSTIFHQSTVPQHAELQWILSCTASMGYLQRMTSWKAKLAQLNPSSTDDPAPKLGLLSYPVLQAADILLHRATHVPVGDDQKQHLEFACECVTNFHAAYLPTKASPRILVRPETILSPAPRVRSLTDPAVKMSKSDPSPRSRLLLTDDRATVRKKVMAAVTDARNEVTWEPEGRPGVANLLRLWGYFDAQGRGPEELAGELRGMGLGALKGAVAEAVSEEMEPIRERFEEIMGRGGGYLEGVVEEGRVKATESAEATMREVRRVVELGA